MLKHPDHYLPDYYLVKEVNSYPQKKPTENYSVGFIITFLRHLLRSIRSTCWKGYPERQKWA